MDDNYKVYILVLNYNNALDTIECIDSLRCLVYRNYEIVLIDNGSTDDSDEIFLEYLNLHQCEQIHYIKNKKNTGYAAGNNVGIRYAMLRNDGRFIWILNNDTVVDSMSLTYLVDSCTQDKVIGICGSKIVYYWNHNIIQGYGGRYTYWNGLDRAVNKKEMIHNINYIMGAAMFVPIYVFEDVGLLNEEYFLYYEELDFVEKIKHNYHLKCEPRSIVYHKEGSSIGSDTVVPINKSLLADYFIVRNKLKFTYKYYKKFIPIICMGIVIMAFKRIIRGQYTRAIMFIGLLIGIKNEEFENMAKMGE